MASFLSPRTQAPRASSMATLLYIRPPWACHSHPSIDNAIHLPPSSITSAKLASITVAMAGSNNSAAAEVNAAVTSLNDHLAPALSGSDEAGAGKTTIITLAGENSGAAMEADAEDLVVVEAGGKEEGDGEEDEEVEVSAYTNSNYQAVNNSVLVAGSCAVRDPGVHVVIVEHVDHIRDCEIFEDGEEVEK